MANGKPQFHKPKSQNPALKRAITEQKISDALVVARNGGIRWTNLAHTVMAIMVLHDKLGITDKNTLKEYCNEINSISNSTLNDYKSLSEFIKVLNTKYGFTLTEDEIAEIAPNLTGFMESK